MDKRIVLINQLKAIVTASRSLVKRLKRVRASPIVIAKFTNLSMSAMALEKRTDYLLPTFRRHTEKLEREFEYALQEINDRYPDLGAELPPSDQLAAPIVEETKTIRVSVTLPVEDWTLIDYYVRNGHVKTYAAYFRQLHRKQNKE